MRRILVTQWNNVREVAASLRKKWTGYLIVAPLLGGLVGVVEQPSMIAEAATASTVHAVHDVWLRSGPQISHNGVKFEHSGENFSVLSGGTSGWWHVRDAQGKVGYVTRQSKWIQTGRANHTVASNAAALPPGVKMDPKIQPRAGINASTLAKEQAVLAVARSKLGTPYRWGHNEDRGQYGFDCSNFTAYVYHHALGYKMSGASLVQARRIGWVVPKSQMRPGDLLIFENGKHVGIYAGNGKMIEEGGGLGKVGYLSVRPGSYWGNHITSVKRMFH